MADLKAWSHGVRKANYIYPELKTEVNTAQGRINAPRGPRHIFGAGPLHPPSAKIKSLSDAMKNRIVF